MLMDNAPLCNGSDTTLSNHSHIALLHLLLLRHVIYLSISSPLAPWLRIVNRSLCERSPFRDLPKSPYDIRSTAKNKLEPIDKKNKMELENSGLNTRLILVGVRVIWHGDDTTNNYEIISLLTLMQYSMRVCIFLPRQEMILRRDSSFLRSSENTLGLQLASAKKSDFVEKQLALEARAYNPLIRFQNSASRRACERGATVMDFRYLGTKSRHPFHTRGKKGTSHMVPPSLPTSVQLDDMLGFHGFSSAASLRRCHHGSTNCGPASQRWRFGPRC